MALIFAKSHSCQNPFQFLAKYSGSCIWKQKQSLPHGCSVLYAFDMFLLHASAQVLQTLIVCSGVTIYAIFIVLFRFQMPETTESIAESHRHGPVLLQKRS